jgi:hypothetical protein
MGEVKMEGGQVDIYVYVGWVGVCGVAGLPWVGVELQLLVKAT